MDENSTKLFNAAVVENGVITNVLVFKDKETMMKFGACILSDGQGIGDTYMTPEEYKSYTTKLGLKESIIDKI